MPANFLSVVYAVFAAAIVIALLVTLVIFGATIFAVAFVYIFIPLFIIASVRWLWLKYKYNKTGRIEFFDNDRIDDR